MNILAEQGSRRRHIGVLIPVGETGTISCHIKIGEFCNKNNPFSSIQRRKTYGLA
jgi:hypothetical protein